MSAPTIVSNHAWENFLKSVDRQALQMARIATGNQDDALDIVQDAMLGLVKRYKDKPVEELRPLFFRIVQNKIRDWHRRQAVRKRWRVWFGSHDDRDGEVFDPVAATPAPPGDEPAHRLLHGHAMAALETALQDLPHRQQQTFLLRAWQGLSVAETACAMHCGEGSVKTHYSRALKSLRKALEDHWP